MNKTQCILNSIWGLAEGYHQELMGLVLPALKAGNIEAVEELLSKDKISAYSSMPNIPDRWELDSDSMPDNSIAVLNLSGIIYSWETFELEQLLSTCINNQRIAGIVLWINGPGGMITNIDVVANLISTSPKPIAAYVAGNAMSAHYWIASSCNRIFVGSKLAMLGSVGILSTFISYKKAYEMQGIDYRVIYPDTSDLKNNETRAIEDNNDEQPMKDMLEIYHKMFANNVASGRGLKYDPEDEFFRGKIFMADVAIANGYADQFGSLNDAIMWVLAQRANSI